MLHAPTLTILAQVQPYLADNQSILQLAGSFLGGF
jgi:hypothetical protein